MSEDLTQKLPSSDSEKITLILTTVQNLDTRTTNLEKRFDNLEKRFDSLEKRFDSFEQRVEERLHDVRPIWQKVVADLAQVQEEVRDIKISMRDMARKMGVLNDTMIKIEADYRELNHRVLDVELEQRKQRNSQT